MIYVVQFPHTVKVGRGCSSRIDDHRRAGATKWVGYGVDSDSLRQQLDLRGRELVWDRYRCSDELHVLERYVLRAVEGDGARRLRPSEHFTHRSFDQITRSVERALRRSGVSFDQTASMLYPYEIDNYV